MTKKTTDRIDHSTEDRNMVRPIKIVKVTDGYQVFINGTPIVVSGNGTIPAFDFDRGAAGLKCKKGYKPPINNVPAVMTATNAASMAHQVGRYILNMGDLVFSYTELVGVPYPESETWFNSAFA